MASDGAPKYRRLADELRARIRSGEFAPGEAIPSKATLMEERHLALGTVNKSIEILRDEGLLYTEQGSGTFVSNPLPDEGAPTEYEIVMSRVDGLTDEVRQLRAEVAAMRRAMEA